MAGQIEAEKRGKIMINDLAASVPFCWKRRGSFEWQVSLAWFPRSVAMMRKARKKNKTTKTKTMHTEQ